MFQVIVAPSTTSAATAMTLAAFTMTSEASTNLPEATAPVIIIEDVNLWMKLLPAEVENLKKTRETTTSASMNLPEETSPAIIIEDLICEWMKLLPAEVEQNLKKTREIEENVNLWMNLLSLYKLSQKLCIWKRLTDF